MNDYVYLVPAMGLIGLAYTLWKFFWVSKQDAGTDRMKEISKYIADGAMAFLRAEWKILTYFVLVVSLLLGYMGSRSEESHWSIALAFVLGAFLVPLQVISECALLLKPMFVQRMLPVHHYQKL